MKRKRSGASPGFIYSGMAVALAVVVAAVTITAAQTAPPTIAEIAPSAINQIKDAPLAQVSAFGDGPGAAVGGGGDGSAVTASTLPPTTLPPAVETRTAPRTRRCVTEPGSPPRQTEDPQSPPCVALWEGKDNGGATSKGVTKDEITIAIPTMWFERELRNIEAHFNKRYEFYGRKLRLVPYSPKGAFSKGDSMEADAAKVDEELKAFASTTYIVQFAGQESTYYNALARRKVISESASFLGPPSLTEAEMTKFHPYQWNYWASVDVVQRNMAEIICKQMVNKPPAYAGAPESSRPVRKFGLIIDATVQGGTPLSAEPLLAPTRRCGAQWEVAQMTPQRPSENESWHHDATRSPIAKLQSAGVTTVICLCLKPLLGAATDNAVVAGFFPEWFIQPFGGQDPDESGWVINIGQENQVIGLRGWNKSLPRAQMPYWNAIREVDATYPETQHNSDTTYWEILMLASGIQMAGPNLTPETFGAALQRTRFPNPSCGKAPFYQACVGFEASHTMIKDFAFVWWKPDGRSEEIDYSRHPDSYRANKGGAYCYQETGRRYSLGTWPTRDLAVFGSNTCR